MSHLTVTNNNDAKPIWAIDFLQSSAAQAIAGTIIFTNNASWWGSDLGSDLHNAHNSGATGNNAISQADLLTEQLQILPANSLAENIDVSAVARNSKIILNITIDDFKFEVK